jgi:hypothetical protein
MSRKSLAWIGAFVLVAGLVAANLALREDPEAELTTVDGRASGRSAEERARSLRQLAVGRAAVGDDDQAEPTPDGVEEEADATPTAGPSSCDNPFVPASLGQFRRYRWQQSDQERTAELYFRALSMREVAGREGEGDEAQMRWRIRVTAEDDDSELAEADMSTRCRPGIDAEEPWFGILERSLGLVLTDDAGRWRWPAELRRGLRFGGAAVFDPRESEMRAPDDAVGPQVLTVTRQHVVEGQESIEVPAGRFRAWKIAYEERHAFGERGETGSRGVTQTIELVRAGGG